MKEIKAYVRTVKIEEVVRALEEAGVPGLCVIDVNAICFPARVEMEKEKLSLEYGDRYRSVSKLEVVCPDADCDRFASIIREKACTGYKGDGYIFVSDIAGVIKIRTGESGETTLGGNNR